MIRFGPAVYTILFRFSSLDEIRVDDLVPFFETHGDLFRVVISELKKVYIPLTEIIYFLFFISDDCIFPPLLHVSCFVPRASCLLSTGAYGRQPWPASPERLCGLGHRGI
jgi:hypothetical protein